MKKVKYTFEVIVEDDNQLANLNIAIEKTINKNTITASGIKWHINQNLDKKLFGYKAGEVYKINKYLYLLILKAGTVYIKAVLLSPRQYEFITNHNFDNFNSKKLMDKVKIVDFVNEVKLNYHYFSIMDSKLSVDYKWYKMNIGYLKNQEPDSFVSVDTTYVSTIQNSALCCLLV